MPRRIGVVVDYSPTFWLEGIESRGPDVVLLRAPDWPGPSGTFEFLVSTSHPVIELRGSCGEWAPRKIVRVELVLHATSIDPTVSSLNRI